MRFKAALVVILLCNALAANPPQRIVSLAPVVTETLFAIGAGKQVVGVTRYCDRPKEAQQIAKIGGILDPQLEAILALRPDLVIAMEQGYAASVISALKKRGIPVFVKQANTLTDTYALISELGTRTSHRAEANKLANKLRLDVQKLKVPMPANPKRVLLLVASKPIVAAGPGTYADEILTLLGFKNALDPKSPRWPTLSKETVLNLKPDIVVTPKPPTLQRPGPYLLEDILALKQLLGQHPPIVGL